MILIIGLGPIGFNVGRNLVALGRDVVGLDLLPTLVAQWSEETGRPGVTSYDQVPWDHVRDVIVSVRTAAQVEDCAAQMERCTDKTDLSVFVTTTLSATDARTLLPRLAARWRTWECPVSGGQEGARNGTMTLFTAGPELGRAEGQLVQDISTTVFEFGAYGEPAVVKLLNNALAAINGLATAQMVHLAEQQGVEVGRFAQVLAVSSGRSWASDNFLTNFGYDLLLKDVRLLLTDLSVIPDVVIRETAAAAETIEAAQVMLRKASIGQ